MHEVKLFFSGIINQGPYKRFSIECRKKTEVIYLANHKRRKQDNEPIRIWSQYT